MSSSTLELGAAKVLKVTKLTSQNFLEAIQDVLHDPSYKNNMQQLSCLHRDTALYWIEYVIRHKGAAHLRTESYQMPWYSYHSLDVISFLLAILFLLATLTVGSIHFFCFKSCRKLKTKKYKE